MRTGIFVKTDDGLGMGKLISVNEKIGQVSFFHSITQREEREYPLNELTRTYLYPHTRVYVQTTKSHWQVGHIIGWDMMDDETIEYEVQFPNKRIEHYSETGLEARCLKPLTEPTEILAFGGIETQFYHDRRKQVLDMLIGFRAASQSMTALLSSVIELVPHQIEVVRRVLEDHLQRYLLADEVGMGKTIEAGIIIRQCLLDEPLSQVVILVPPHLVNQWQHELADKFRIQHFPSSVSVLPYAQAAQIQAQNLDMLVIDEAHHVVSQTEGFKIAGATRHLIKKQALASKRLLLLSAIPALGHEETMLAMLNLLDADTYRLEDLAAFKEKVHKRQEYGRLLLGLRSDANNDVLRQQAQQASELFADDAIATDLAAQLTASVQNENTEQTTQLCHQLRSYIAETYRLHHRVIRTRRSDTQGWEFLPRGPFVHNGKPVNLSHVRVEIDEDDRLPALINLLEQWRAASQSGLADDPNKEIQLARRYVRLFEALGCGADELAHTLEQLDDTQSEAYETEIIAAMRATLAKSAGEFDRYAVAIQCLTQLRKVLQQAKPNSPLKIIVFSSSTTDAQCLYQRLKAALNKSAVYALLTETESSEDEALPQSLVHQFCSDNKAWLLICDRHSEEGQNLHFADAILHLNLPFSPARIEQRIVRLDRFGRTQSVIRHRVLLPSDEDDSPWFAWYELLAYGFQIFNRSVSDVQFLLQEIEEKLIRQFYRQGTPGLIERADDIKNQLQAERERLDEQSVLDQVTMGQRQTLFEAIETAEEDENAIKQAINGWLFNVLNFYRNPKPQDKEPFSLSMNNKHIQIPREPWQLLFEPSMETQFTYRRNTAVRQRDVDLIRCGNNLVDVLEQFFGWDDQGTVFATWRINPAWLGQDTIWTGFRLCYLVRTDFRPFKEVVSENESLAGLQRRADGFLPPWTVTLHIDSHLEEVSDPDILSILERPYKTHASKTGVRDYNLGSRIETIHNIFESDIFISLCRQVRDISERRLRESRVFQEHLTKAIATARTEIEHHNERLKQRQEAQQRELSKSIAPSIERDIALNEMLLQCIEKPLVRLDAIGFFVIAGVPPSTPKNK
jgi:ATP-dependent helicase HepA